MADKTVYGEEQNGWVNSWNPEFIEDESNGTILSEIRYLKEQWVDLEQEVFNLRKDYRSLYNENVFLRAVIISINANLERVMLKKEIK